MWAIEIGDAAGLEDRGGAISQAMGASPEAGKGKEGHSPLELLEGRQPLPTP